MLFSIPTLTQPSAIANAASSNYGRGRFYCTHCGKTTHTVDKCFYLHDFPLGFGRGKGKSIPKDPPQSRSINFVDESHLDEAEAPASVPIASLPSSDQYQQLISLLQSQLAASSSTTPQNPSTSSVPPNSFSGTTLSYPFISAISFTTMHWLLDTGATHHVCCDISLFNTSSPVKEAFVNLPSGATATVTHIGSIHLTPTIKLYSVLCVPSFSFDLISVSSLTKSLSCSVTFTHNSFEIQEASQGIVIGKGSRIGNLYTLDLTTDSSSGSFPSSSINSVVSIETWHKRHGHLSFAKLKSMSDV